MEQHFQRLSQWGGSYATAEGRAEEAKFWSEGGRPNFPLYRAEWLLRRLRRAEMEVDASDRTAGLLTRLRCPGLLVSHLSAHRTIAYTVLTALSWWEEKEPLTLGGEMVLKRYLGDEDPCLREQAVAATRILSRERQVAILDECRQTETDTSVLDSIEEELAA